MNAEIRVGIIGFGRIGAEHAQWLARCESIRAVAAVDPTPARRELAQQCGLRAQEHLEILLQDPDVDAVLVSTPTAMHHEHASRALSMGKHVMIEKPMALDLNQTRDLLERARAAGKVLSVFHNRRWDRDYLTLKSAVEAGTFGKLINVESRIGQWASCVGPAAPQWHPNWRNEASFGGGGFYDWGSHLVDQLWRLLHPARPVSVFAQLRGNVWTKDCDDFARVCLNFDDGAVGMVEINTTSTRPLPRWHVDGTFGSAEGPYSLTFDTSTWAEFSFTPASGVEAQKLPLAQAGLDEGRIWEQFAHAVRNQRPPAVRAESVLPTMALLDAARRSSEIGRAVEPDKVDWVL